VANELYEAYYQILEDHFGRYYKDDNPIESVNRLLKQPMTYRVLYETSDTVIEEIFDLFNSNSSKISRDIKSLEGIKTHYCGNIAPQDAERFLCQTGLYVDTTIISDPVSYIFSFKEMLSSKSDYINLLFKYTFNMLKLKSAAINDSERPILHIIPKPIFMREINHYNEEPDTTCKDYFNCLLDENAKSIDDTERIISEIKSKEELIDRIDKADILIPEIREANNLAEGFDLFHDSIKSRYTYKINSISEGLFLDAKGRFIQSSLNFDFASNFRLINSFDTENSWHIYKWMLQSQAKKIDNRALIVNALTLDKVKWFGDLKLEDVVKARENYCLQDFRDIINKEISFIDEDRDLSDVANQIHYNLTTAFEKHQKDLLSLKQDYKFNYVKTYSGVVVGSLSLLTGILTLNPVTSTIGTVTLGSSLIGWIKLMKDYCDKEEGLISSPTGMLFKVKGKCNEQ
jgi:hypothetical protein